MAPVIRLWARMTCPRALRDSRAVSAKMGHPRRQKPHWMQAITSLSMGVP